MSSNILKSYTATVDYDNKVLIEVPVFPDPPEPEEEIPESTEDDFTEEEIEIIPPEVAAEEIIRGAKQEAEEIIARAKSEAEAFYRETETKALAESMRIKSEAQEEGYQEGMRKAQGAGEAIKAEANQVLENAKRECADMIAAAEPDMVELISRITEKLLSDSVRIHPGVVVNLIKQGISGATMTGDVSIRVSAGDYEYAAAKKDELQSMADASVRMDIIKDLSLAETDCVIETPFGNIDCSLGQQFEALKENLFYILRGK